jgi:hypothetical protein
METYLMILEKLPILTNLKTFYYLGMEMNANVMQVNNFNIIKVFSIDKSTHSSKIQQIS